MTLLAAPVLPGSHPDPSISRARRGRVLRSPFPAPGRVGFSRCSGWPRSAPRRGAPDDPLRDGHRNAQPETLAHCRARSPYRILSAESSTGPCRTPRTLPVNTTLRAMQTPLSAAVHRRRSPGEAFVLPGMADRLSASRHGLHMHIAPRLSNAHSCNLNQTFPFSDHLEYCRRIRIRVL
jgi:hypothetical protein